jgi:hypothetical protein
MGYDANMPITPQQFDEAFMAFARLGKGGYGDLAAQPGIVEDMKAIKDAGIDIEIWTWTPGAAEIQPDRLVAYGTGIAQRVTLDLIERLKLPVKRNQVRFIKPGSKPWEMAEEHIPLIVEDSVETAVGVAMTVGHAAILVQEPYNEGIEARNILRVPRKDLAPAVITFYRALDEAGVLL